MIDSKKNLFCRIGLLIFILILSFVFSISVYSFFESIFFEKLAVVMGVVTKDSRNLEIEIMNQLKFEHSKYASIGKGTLGKYGYNLDRFIFLKDRKKIIYISFLFSVLITSIFCIYMYISTRNKKKNAENLKNYLERINEGDYSLNLATDEDFSILSDELYKTVITLRELKEKAIQDKISLKDNIADISHQLKTPITAINIMSELIENNDSKDENKEYIYRLNKQAGRLETLTNSLLTISKLDAGTIKFKKDIVYIKDIIDLAIEPIMFLIEKKNIKLYIVGDNAIIKGDSYWLGEAFLNIIKNCIEHLEDNGEINLFIESNPIFTEVKIEDNGSGFLKEDLPHIFKRFYKGKNANKDSIGIGLSIAKSIIEKHNGEISVENKKEGGARFKIKFY
ncbi:sensor histidine kinase [Anaerosalibacter massiliensis]|uniref:histidine kinase n=1 Tax=Anaerosalibacter massiliensis TaxID=1347392 RepID=A0A9X2S571_9FIRM|nr:HAMP domain-containing sensor histidine kinase [Anaerosalibacter massiliensis]MCR2044024.1 HAMP domain-containing histidine kinase [Anaerosalibacter massiliensis]